MGKRHITYTDFEIASDGIIMSKRDKNLVGPVARGQEILLLKLISF